MSEDHEDMLLVFVAFFLCALIVAMTAIFGALFVVTIF